MVKLGLYIESEYHRLFPQQVIAFRSAFVSYKDIGEADHLQSTEFSEDPSPVARLLLSVTASGGGDFAEDVAGGLNVVSKLDWHNANRVLVHVLDAPPHGREFHSMGARNDNYYDAPHPNNIDLKAVIKDLATKRVDYTMVRCGDSEQDIVSTDQYGKVCCDIYDEVVSEMKHQGVRGRLPVFRDLKLGTAHAKDFFELVVTSSMVSVRKSCGHEVPADKFSKAVVRESKQ
eukprot:ANDGO_08357.mRNA.1 Alpha-protein kinase vwkA